MTEVLFFHLQRQPVEKVLPTLLTRCQERGWRALVKAATEERLGVLDDHLWSFSDDSFLAHGTALEPDPADQPILLTLNDANPNRSTVLFLVEGAEMPAEIAAFERVTLLFDGTDDEAVAAARRVWSDVKAAGHEASYWQQGEGGRWEKRA